MTKLKKQHRPPEQVPVRLRICCEDSGGIKLEAAAETEEDKPQLRRFSMTAYTGGPMSITGWRYPVVVDLAGLRVPRKSRPILKDHDRGQIVGHTDGIRVTDGRMEVTGVISGAGATAAEVIATSQNGFPWQSSLGATADKVVFIAEGKTAKANGQEFSGPLYIARKATLGEVSFVALGADDETSAHVAAGAANRNLEVTTMESLAMGMRRTKSMLIAWGLSEPTTGACMTCTGTCGNGAGIGITWNCRVALIQR